MSKARHLLWHIGGGLAAGRVPALAKALHDAGFRLTPRLSAEGARWITPELVAAAFAEKASPEGEPTLEIAFPVDDSARAELKAKGALLLDEALSDAALIETIAARFRTGPLSGQRILITSGPTHEPIDPVRYIANRSSGAQGTAIAAALRDLGAHVVFVTGPASVPAPSGVELHRVESARDMLDAALAALPADAAVMAAAVADWRVANAGVQKIKKIAGALPTLSFTENPDILATVSQHPELRPPLVIGFAAETETVIAHAQAKRARKGCDWIVANDVSPATGIMGGSENAVHIITEEGVENWPRLPKGEVARRLADRIAAALTSSKKASL